MPYNDKVYLTMINGPQYCTGPWSCGNIGLMGNRETDGFDYDKAAAVQQQLEWIM